jgi:membrane protease YdiL (CAAX protease family)
MAYTLSARPFLAVSNFRFRLWPILLAAVLMEGLLRLGRAPARLLYKLGDFDDDRVWFFVLLAILFQAILGLVAIAAMKRLLPQADAHLRWPSGRSYAGLAVAIGFTMGVVMLVADYWPQLVSGTAPDTPYSLHPLDVTGWLTAMLITGLAEETIFRGLLVGFLVVLVPGRIRAGTFDIPVAAVIVALIFGLAHWQSFSTDPFHMALAQQIYAFTWGLIYVWLMERSRSLLAPMVAHGVGNAVEVGFVMLFIGAWA